MLRSNYLPGNNALAQQALKLAHRAFRRPGAVALMAGLMTSFFALLAHHANATPEAHILRIDPRAGKEEGKPILTTVVEIVDFKRLSDALMPCANRLSPQATLTCWSEQLEKPGALWEAFPFPEQNAHFVVKVLGEDRLARFLDKTAWGNALDKPNVGTAWLVAIDSASAMESRFGDARAIAHELIEQMQPNDLGDVMFFDDVQVVRDTKWKPFSRRAELGNALNEFKSPSPSHGRDRSLFSEIKSMTEDAFGSLANFDQPGAVPLHQAMVVLSNGSGRGDAESANADADVLHPYLNRGRFPSDNTLLPKTPLPVVSLWLPNETDLKESPFRDHDAQFMLSLANPEMGGFFDVVPRGAAARAKGIFNLVRARFNAMWLVRWTVSCINPSLEQSFGLAFENTHPSIAPDTTFKEVPFGIDPTEWPLDIDTKRTVNAAEDSPIFPGGQATIYGDFCWGTDKARAEAYFAPSGTKLWAGGDHDLESGKKVLQALQAGQLLGAAVAAGDGYLTLSVPDDARVLDSTGDRSVAHVVVYDNKTHRASALDDKNVLTLAAKKKPLPIALALGISGLALVVVLLSVALFRGGGSRIGSGDEDISQVPVSSDYEGLPQIYAGSPSSAGMNAGPADPLATTEAAPHQGALPTPLRAPRGNPFGPQQANPFGPPLVTGPLPGVLQAPREPSGLAAAVLVSVRCPACGNMTTAPDGQHTICSSCGQPLAATRPLAIAHAASPGNGIAVMRGQQGHFVIHDGVAIRVGRDPSQCPIFLKEPRVSGVHATVKFEGGQVAVRDEHSNNGTWLSGSRLPPGVWTPVPLGTPLRFGPVEFAFQIQAEG